MINGHGKPFGLPLPQDTATAALGLHVLSLSGEMISLAGVISNYGLIAAPGQQLSIYDEAKVPRIVTRLTPFDPSIHNSAYVLPCDQDDLNTLVSGYNLPLWQQTEDAVRAYIHVFRCTKPTDADAADAADDAGDAGNDAESLFDLSSHILPPTPEDVTLARLCGMQWTTPSFRLGDMLNELAKENGHATHLSTFLSTAIAELGVDASIGDALSMITSNFQKHATATLAYEKQISDLSMQLDAFVAKKAAPAAPAAPEPAAAAAAAAMPAPTAAPTAATPTIWSGDVVERLLNAFSMVPCNEGVVLKLPIKKKRIVGTLRVFNAATGLELADDKANWAIANAGLPHLTSVQTISMTLASFKQGNAVLVLLVQKSDHAQIFRIETPDVPVSTSPNELLAVEDVRFIHWNDTTNTIVAFEKRV